VKEKKVAESSSDTQIDIQSVAAESQQGHTGIDKEKVVVETARSLARELGTSTAHIVKQKIVEDAERAQKLAEDIQSSTAEKVDGMIMSTMKVKRKQGTSKAFSSKAGGGNSSIHNLLIIQ